MAPALEKTSALLALVLGGGACTTVHPIGRTPTENELRHLAVVAEGRTVTLTLASEQALAVGGLRTEGTRLRWTSPEAGSAAWSDVRKATLVRHDVGFWQGAGLGALAGFAIGGTVGFVAGVSCTPAPPPSGDPPGNCPLDLNPSFGQGLRAGALLGVLFAIPSALLGGVIGAVIGSPTVFTNGSPESSR